MKRRLNPVLIKIIVSFLIITMLPSLIIAFFLYPKMHQILNDQIEDQFYDSAQMTLDSLNREFYSILRSSVEFNSLLDQIRDESSTYLYNLKITNLLKLLHNSSSLIERTILYAPGSHEIYTSTGLVTDDFFLRDLFHSGERGKINNPFLDLDTVRPELIPLESFSFTTFPYSPSDYIGISFPIAPNQWLIYFIPVSKLHHMISSTVPQGACYVLSDHDGVIVSRSPEIDPEQLDYLSQTPVEEIESSYTVLRTPCHVLSLEFGLYAPNFSLYSQLNTLLAVTLLIIFSIVVVGTALMFYSIRTNYRPLIAILRHISPNRSPHSEKNIYDQITSEIYDMQASNTELRSTLQNYRKNYKNIFLYELFSQSIQNITDISNVEERLETELYGRILVPLFLRFRQIPSSAKPIRQVVEELNHRFCRHPGDDIQAVFSNCIQKKTIFCLISLNSRIADTYSASIQQFFDNEIIPFLKKKDMTSFYALLGSTCGDIYNIREPIQILYQLMDSNLAEEIPDGNIIDVQDANSFSQLDRQPMYAIYNLTHAVDQRDLAAVNDSMNCIFHILYSSTTPLAVSKLLFGQAMYVFNTVTGTSGSQSKQLQPSELYSVQQMGTILKEEQEKMEQVLSDDEKNLKTHNRDIKTYIDQHFMDPDFSISKVAEHYRMQISNLSTYFKSHYGMTFQQYSSSKKVEIARELLAQKDLTLDEISDRLGYANASSFSRSFKRELQMTPGEYRKSIS